MSNTYYLKKMTRYKRHFVCFDCRKTYKQPNEKDMAEQQGDLSLMLNAFYYFKPKKKVSKDVIEYLKKEYFQKPIKCPQCAENMTEVSLSFEAPPKSKIKEWQSIKSYYAAKGIVCNGLPKKQKDLVLLLEKSLDWHLQMIRNPHNHKSYKEKVEDTKIRLKNNLERIKKELENLKANKYG